MKQKLKKIKDVKKIKNPKGNIILRICILAFVVYAGVQLVDMQLSLSVRKQELAQLQGRYEMQRLANKDMERQLEAGVDDEYIERIARERLDYIAEDETVFIDVSGN